MEAAFSNQHSAVSENQHQKLITAEGAEESRQNQHQKRFTTARQSRNQNKGVPEIRMMLFAKTHRHGKERHEPVYREICHSYQGSSYRI